MKRGAEGPPQKTGKPAPENGFQIASQTDFALKRGLCTSFLRIRSRYKFGLVSERSIRQKFQVEVWSAGSPSRPIPSKASHLSPLPLERVLLTILWKLWGINNSKSWFEGTFSNGLGKWVALQKQVLFAFTFEKGFPSRFKEVPNLRKARESLLDG